MSVIDEDLRCRVLAVLRYVETFRTPSIIVEECPLCHQDAETICSGEVVHQPHAEYCDLGNLIDELEGLAP